ncbi:MAG: dinitrogenase iron-molybdenum cofactor biosynthesis protein, partial [Anaerolineae bacterium]|nr:dinitrogenase iron-molybdenum cofactor biosynthesis protein [Anaerolineae bacterium]
MKIAFVTDDQQTISQHFGRAEYYLVISIEDGQENGRELRAKLGHRQFAQESGHHEHPHQDHDHHAHG